jgi:hypothetical protein
MSGDDATDDGRGGVDVSTGMGSASDGLLIVVEVVE